MLSDVTRFYTSIKLQFDSPSRRVEILPFIPLESAIDSPIGGLGRNLSAFTRSVKETGARPIEIFQLQWIDIDAPNSTVNTRPKKGSRPRRHPKITRNPLASILELQKKEFTYSILRWLTLEKLSQLF